MTLCAGSCIRIQTKRGQSIHILVTDPDSNGRGLFVPLDHFDTYLSDPTVATVDGHSWIRTKMAADYPNAEVWDVSAVEGALLDVDSGVTCREKEPRCSEELLTKLRHGLFRSKKVSERIEKYADAVLHESYRDPMPEEDEDDYWA